MYPSKLILAQGEKLINVKKILTLWGCTNRKVYIWTACFIYMILLIMSEVKYSYDVRDDFDAASSTIIYYVSALMGLYKICVNLFFRKRINKMHAIIAEEFLDLSNVQGKVSVRLNLRLMRIDKAMVTWCAGTLFGCLFLFMHPPAKFPEGQRTLPDTVWLPFDTNPSPLHEVLYFIFGVGRYSLVVGILAYDLLFLYFTQCLSVQFIILKELLRNICEVPEINDDDKWDSDYYQDIINKRIKECVKHHILLIGFHNDLKDVYSLSLFFQFLVSIVLTVFSDFMMKKGRLDTIQTITMLTAVMAEGIEILLMAISGGEVEYQSETVASAVYCSRWYFGKKPFRKSLNILQMNSQTPLKISAAGLTYVNNQLIITSYKAIFSVLTLIDALGMTSDE